VAVAEDIGCRNQSCIRSKECNRAKIYKNGEAKEVKSFGGTPEKGCSKFLPIKKN
jgi:hypothetical protein